MNTLQDAKGQVIIITSIIISVVFSIFVFTLYFIFKTGTTASLHDKLANRAIEVCDVGISQMISDIHRHAIDIALVPVTTYYAIVKYPDSNETEQVKVTLKLVPDTNDVDNDGNTAEPETDLEGNNIYQIESSAWGSLLGGIKITRRNVAARISIVNLAKYNLFYVENDLWGNFSTLTSGTPIMLDGPYHTNGTLSLGGIIYFNNQYLPNNPGTNNQPGATVNSTYNPLYTVMCAKQIRQLDDPVIYLSYPNTTYTQNNQVGRLSADASFSVCPTATMPRGTWFDQAHGGFEIHLEPLDFVKYQSMAQVIIDKDDLPNFKVFGANYSSNNLLINNGAGEQVVDIDLAFLGSGTSKDICQGLTNYENALNSQYGLVVFVNGPIAVHGKLAECAAFPNNKKITLITTDTVDVLGDILVSGDPYFQILDSFSTNPGVNAWDDDTANANANTQRTTSAAVFTGAPYKNVDSSAMRLRIKDDGSGTGQVMLKKHFAIVAPPAGIDNNKIFVNIRGEDAAATADVVLQLRDAGGGVIASTGPVHVDQNWQRIVLVRDSPTTTLSLTDINNFNANANENLEIVFTNFDSNWREFYLDELGFAFGKSYPIAGGTANPTGDAIAIIAQDNIYENAYYLYNPTPNEFGNWLFVAGYPDPPVAYADSIKYFAVNGDYVVPNAYSGFDTLYYDLRMDAFFYTALDNTEFTVHTINTLNMFTVYGATISHKGGSVRALTFNNSFDQGLANNVSKAIPVGSVIHTYQQLR